MPQHRDARRTARHFGRLLEGWGGELEELNGEPDHVHLLLRMHAAAKCSVLLNSLKTASSRLIRRDHGKKLRAAFPPPGALERSCSLRAAAPVLRAHIEDHAGAGQGPPAGFTVLQAHALAGRTARQLRVGRSCAQDGSQPFTETPREAFRSREPPGSLGRFGALMKPGVLGSRR